MHADLAIHQEPLLSEIGLAPEVVFSARFVLNSNVNEFSQSIAVFLNQAFQSDEWFLPPEIFMNEQRNAHLLRGPYHVDCLMQGLCHRFLNNCGDAMSEDL